VTAVPIGVRTADHLPMGLRGSAARRDEQSDGGELEGWIADLAGGETSVRRLRRRLDEQRDTADGGCTTCGCAGEGHLAQQPA
jgi:hypothetical protein